MAACKNSLHVRRFASALAGRVVRQCSAPAGNISQIDSDAGAITYSYDRLGRLTQASPDNTLQAKGLPPGSYSYDAAGNRTHSAHQAGAWLYNADNQLTSYPRTLNLGIPGSQTEQTDISYTPQGHTSQETGASWQRSYQYNASERLSELSQGNTTVRYRYDPFGRRISKSVTQGGSTSTTYYLNGESALMAEAGDDGQITRAYGFNPNTQGEAQELWSTDPVWQAELRGQSSLGQASFHYLATDHLGTPLIATDTNGNQSWRSFNQSFGSARIDSASSIEMNLRFPGQYFDKETNLHQNYYRDYNPMLGRYLQSDPIGLDGGMNNYAYGDSNPLYYVDSDGKFFIVPALVGGGLSALADLTFQLWSQDGRFDCINWARVGMAGAAGAIGGAWWAGAFRHSASGGKWLQMSHRWNSVRQRYGRAHNLPPGKDVHHWLVTQGSKIGKKYPGLTNHPWNLNPTIPNAINRGRFNKIGWMQMVIEGSPGWARASAGFLIGGTTGEAISYDCNSCN